MSEPPLVERGSWANDKVPIGWCWADFDHVFVNVTSSDRKVKQEDYAKSGAYPVIDQGEDPIGGYTDDASLVQPEPPPFIVFGDHTRCVKYVTQPFVQGADGVKVLKIAGIEPRYAMWALRTLRLPNKGYSRHYQFLRNSRFPIAPLPEQCRIVAKIEELFSELDAGVAALVRVRANLKRYRAAVLKAAVEGRLTEEWRARNPETEPASDLLERILAERRATWEQDQLRKFKEAGKTPSKGWKDRYEPPMALDEEWTPPSLPPEWIWCTVAQAAGFDDHSITDGPFGSNLKTEHYTGFGPRVIRLQNIGDGVFVDEYAHISESHYEMLARHRLASGDIVIAMMGEWLPRACPIPDAALPAIVKADCARFACNPSLGLTAYFSIALNAKPTRDLASRRIKGVGRPRLNLTSVRSIAIPLPPPAEQIEIVAEVERRLSVADAAEKEVEHALQRAARLRQAILKRAFEGRLVPQDPNDEPANALLERVRSRAGEHVAVVRNKSTSLDKPARRRTRADA